MQLNPLAIASGRYSLQAEYLPAAHHAITLNPYYLSVPVTVTLNGKEIDGGSIRGFGGELGYRFYSNNAGPNGFFVGPSFLLSTNTQTAPEGRAAAGSSGSDSFMSYGAAVDVGGQVMFGPGILIGAGIGLQYTKNSQALDTDNLNLASAVIADGGIRPRFLFAAGFAF